MRIRRIRSRTMHVVKVALKSDRSTADLTDMVNDLLIDLSEGYLGDPSDWHTFTVVGDKGAA